MLAEYTEEHLPLSKQRAKRKPNENLEHQGAPVTIPVLPYKHKDIKTPGLESNTAVAGLSVS